MQAGLLGFKSRCYLQARIIATIQARLLGSKPGCWFKARIIATIQARLLGSKVGKQSRTTQPHPETLLIPTAALWPVHIWVNASMMEIVLACCDPAAAQWAVVRVGSRQND
eukprot:144276-Chlamydomonas_euryale.AAC.2